MNPHATTLVIAWMFGGLVSLAVAIGNYLNAASDGRLMRVASRNGLLALAARDERQAELFRILTAACFTLTGAFAANGGAPMWATFYLVLGLVSIGLSSVRARWNRKAQLTYAERAVPRDRALVIAEAAEKVAAAAVDKAEEFRAVANVVTDSPADAGPP